jgi:hypothetical protein
MAHHRRLVEKYGGWKSQVGGWVGDTGHQLPVGVMGRGRGGARRGEGGRRAGRGQRGGGGEGGEEGRGVVAYRLQPVKSHRGWTCLLEGATGPQCMQEVGEVMQPQLGTVGDGGGA